MLLFFLVGAFCPLMGMASTENVSSETECVEKCKELTKEDSQNFCKDMCPIIAWMISSEADKARQSRGYQPDEVIHYFNG